MVGTTGERLGGGGSPVATDRIVMFKKSFLGEGGGAGKNSDLNGAL